MGKVAEIIGGGTPSTTNKEYWDGDIDWYSPVEIGEQIYVDGSQKKITKLGLQKSSAKILPVGTILFTSRAGIGNTAILAKRGATNQGFQSVVPHKEELDSYFIYSKTHELKRYGETNGAGSTFVEVSGKQMAKMPILIPNLDEQKKIGDFFAHLDNLIAANQRKLDKLKLLKKGYLQQIFEQKLRFNGYSEPWGKRKVSDLSGETYGGGTPKTTINKYWDGNIPWIQSSNIEIDNVQEIQINKFVTDESIQNSATKLVPANSIAIVTRVGVGKLVLMNRPYTTSQDFLSLSKLTVAPQFGLYAMYKLLEHEANITQGTSIKGITKLDLLGKSINIPKNLEEQTKIGTLFEKLENLIATNQNKLDHLKKLKKAYLQQMFI